GVGDTFQPSRHVDAVAVDASLVVDDITDVDADAELHTVFWVNSGIALYHLGLDRDRTFDCVHHAREFGKNAVASRVDDATTELSDHRQDDCLMPLEIMHRAHLVRAHQRAVTGNVRSKDGC